MTNQNQRKKKLMFNLSLKNYTTDHLEIVITPEKWFENIPTDHILTQIIKDHFTFLYGQKHQHNPFVKLLVNSHTMADLIYTVDENLSKQLESFINDLVPETSIITFYKDNEPYNYQYLGEKDKIMSFKQLRYDNDYEPVVAISILK